MSELVQMRQRIKAIETIQKITHAMRLIAMSAHSRLKRKEADLKHYIDTINILFSKVYKLQQDWHNPIMKPKSNHTKILVILVGSQKGLCGTFNTNLFTYFTQQMARHAESTFDSIAIGKKAIDFLNRNHTHIQVISAYNNFSIRTIFTISQTIADLIIHAPTPYSSVIMFSNDLKSFFIQKPIRTNLIPLVAATSDVLAPTEGYLWEQEPTVVLDTLAHHYLEAHIQHLLFTSLYAEQAARFLSMDNATRNAVSLLENSKILYNKLRQAKITKELTELTGSL
jgi:F-type H+-transporting ATPase subunit gamma